MWAWLFPPGIAALPPELTSRIPPLFTVTSTEFSGPPGIAFTPRTSITAPPLTVTAAFAASRFEFWSPSKATRPALIATVLPAELAVFTTVVPLRSKVSLLPGEPTVGVMPAVPAISRSPVPVTDRLAAAASFVTES